MPSANPLSSRSWPFYSVGSNQWNGSSSFHFFLVTQGKGLPLATDVQNVGKYELRAPTMPVYL